MNDRAAQLGLKETRFQSVHGLPPEAGQQDDVMSAADLATLGREIMKFPQMLHGWRQARSRFVMVSSR